MTCHKQYPYEMVGSRKYERNFYATPQDAEASARSCLRKNRTFYVLVTDEGLFDWSVNPEPSEHLPWTQAQRVYATGNTSEVGIVLNQPEPWDTALLSDEDYEKACNAKSDDSAEGDA